MEHIDYKLLVENIRNELRSYLKKYNLKALIIGESGGIDSAVCTALAKPVCDELNVELIGRYIFIETNKQDETDRAGQIGKAFCSNFKDVDLTEEYLIMRKSVEEDIESDEFKVKLRRGNIKARMRMIYLYNLAQYAGGIVISTDNYTEFLQGFWTLHGDVGDYGPIAELWKTEVYNMSKWLVENELTNPDQKQALQACIDAVPTDGLGISSSDLEQLGVKTYDEVDEILQQHKDKTEYADNPVVKRYKASAYKRTNPYNLKRKDLIK
ncbi:MAG: NAD(+) synthase [Marinifilaceae bacterium]|jgi:NAD+ synthetase|nr:NAD(+) synthase [Marinifilaceae bacterium]